MITNGKAKTGEPSVVASFSDLAHDVVELGELQTQLLKLDVTAAWLRMKTGVVLLVVGACLLLGCIPILWLTIAESLVEFADWSRTAAMGVAFLIGVAVAGAFTAIAWIKLKAMFETFERSRDELNRNIAWIKSSLKRTPAAVRGERRAEVPMPS